ncbi:MAG TPA: ABC transporter permease [Ilumatobacteraceae bacterium]|nr:ABC transporter permease [Ilumatobacteraceae bacterium]
METQTFRTERQNARRENWHLLRRKAGFIIGVFIVAIWTVCAIFGSRLAPRDPARDLDVKNLSPRRSHWFGTDIIGRDVLSRVIAGARNVLLIAPVAAMLSIIAGAILGLMMGYFRGVVDMILSRIVETFLALPVVLVGLLALVIFGSSRVVVIGVVATLFTPIVTRTVRSAVLAEADLDYVTSARLRGESSLFIMFREILPNVSAPIVVEFTVRVGYAIFTVASLSFLGVGVATGSPDWGSSIADHYRLMNDNIWWSTLFPALAITSLVIAVNLIADSIQAVYDR